MGDREPCLRRRQYVLLALEELEISLNVFNELDDADFSRYSSPTGEKYRSSSSETGRPAATPLRRGVLALSMLEKKNDATEQIRENHQADDFRCERQSAADRNDREDGEHHVQQRHKETGQRCKT